MSLSLYTGSPEQHRAAIRNNLGVYATMWGEMLPSKMSQTEFFTKNIPAEEVDFTGVAEDFGLTNIFTSDKVVTQMLGTYNCNMVFRAAGDMPDIIVYNNDKYVVLQPLGEPGRDLGAHKYRGAHLMVVTRPRKGMVVTLNDMLPMDENELVCMKERLDILDEAFKAVSENRSVKECGDMVCESSAGQEIGIRDFMVQNIAAFTDEFRGGRPGYKLLNESGEDVADKARAEIQEYFDTVFSSKNTHIVKYIQGPDKCSQLMSHIHGFMMENGVAIPGDISENYISADMLYEEACLLGGEEEDEGCDLVRTVSRRVCGMVSE